MNQLDKIPELREAIAAHAAALASGDSAAAEAFAVPGALETHRQAAAEIARIARPVKVETLALAKVGFQYISKLRFTDGGGAMRRVLYRWRKEAGGKWLIAAVEDTTNKRSPWSDVPDLAAAVALARAGNGNA